MLHFSHYGGVDLCNDGEIDRDDILLVTTAQKHGPYREAFWSGADIERLER